MQIAASAPATMGLDQIGQCSERVERIGFDAIQVAETVHDPFVLAATALAHTSRLTVRTSMVLAFPPSPIVVAYSAWDLAKYFDDWGQGPTRSGTSCRFSGRHVSFPADM